MDLDPDGQALSGFSESGGSEGIADVLWFGVSLRRAVREMPGQLFRFLPLGSLGPDGDRLLDHPRWERVLAEAERRGLTLLAFTASDRPGLEALARRAGSVVLLANAVEEGMLRALLPDGVEVREVVPVDEEAPLPPPTVPAPEPAPAGVDELAHPEPGEEERAGQAEPPVAEDTEGEPATPEPPVAADRPAPTGWMAWLARLGGSAAGVAERVASTAAGWRAGRTRRRAAPLAEAPNAKARKEDETSLPGRSFAEWLAAEESRLAAEPESAPPGEVVPTAGPPRPPLLPPLPAEEPQPAAPEAGEPDPTPVEGEDAPSIRSVVPRTSPTRETVVRISAILILCYWAYYIGWRWTYTLNPDALWFSIPLVLAETWGLVTALFLVFTTWRLRDRSPAPPGPGLQVDVFVTTFDEPLEVIRRTATSARGIRYPHRTYVLDDGRREEIRSMAAELGIGYLRRETREHGKAGNLDHALKLTSGDFILQLDAGHAPLPHILDRLLGFFEDARVAFVQTPQDFYDAGSFASDVREDEQPIREERRLFFSLIQPGTDARDSALFCGSCAVVRRAALEEIGGFSTRGTTDEVATSMLLHGRGWTSVYYGESLAHGLAAGTAGSFHAQHLREAQRTMQVLRTMNPLTHPGLSLSQRIGYFSSLSDCVTGLQRLIFYLAPIVFFMTGVLPVRALDRDFLIRFLPYPVLAVVLVELLSRGLGFAWVTERNRMARFWACTRALSTSLIPSRLRSTATPRGSEPGPPSVPHLVLMGLTSISVAWATLAHALAWVDYRADGWGSVAFQLNLLWALVNLVLAASVVRLGLLLRQHRQDHRFADRFPIQVRPRGAYGRSGESQAALTEELNAFGVSFRSAKPLEVGSRIELTLPLSTRELIVDGTVMHVRRESAARAPIFVHRAEFEHVSLDARDAIEIHCSHHAVPVQQMRSPHGSDVVSQEDWTGDAGGKPGRRVRLPTRVLVGEREGSGGPRESIGVLEEISSGGARLIMNEAVPPGTPVAFDVPGTGLKGEGIAVFSRALETPIGVRFAVRVQREPNPETEPSPREG